MPGILPTLSAINSGKATKRAQGSKGAKRAPKNSGDGTVKASSKTSDKKGAKSARRAGDAMTYLKGTGASDVVQVLGAGVTANVLDAWAVDRGHPTSFGALINRPGTFYDVDLRALSGGLALAAGIFQPTWFKGFFRRHSRVLRNVGTGVLGAWGLEKTTTMASGAFKAKDKASSSSVTVPSTVQATTPEVPAGGITIGRIGRNPQERSENLIERAEKAVEKGNYAHAIDLLERAAAQRFGGGKVGKQATALALLSSLKPRALPGPAPRVTTAAPNNRFVGNRGPAMAPRSLQYA